MIELKNVSFRYKDSEQDNSLTNVNLSIHDGEVVLNEFGIGELVGRNLFHLSGGEKQKIACASVSIPMPDIFVLDEPTSNLDWRSIWMLKDIIMRWKAQGKTVIVAEHRLSYLKGVADRVVYMNDGEIKEDMPADTFWSLSADEIKRRGLRSISPVAFGSNARTPHNSDCYSVKDLSFHYKDGVAVLCISVLGRFFFQWLMDISMSAKGFDIFRDYRLHVGALMRKAPMGYFSEQRLGSIQNVLTTTVTELEQYSMMAVTDLTSGALMALVMIVFFLFSVPVFAVITLAGSIVGILILHAIGQVAREHAPKVLAAQEDMTTQALEYIRGIAVLRAFSQADGSENAVYASFRKKKEADLAQEHASMALMKWYSAVYKITGSVLMLAAVLLYLAGSLSLPWCLMVIVSAFIIFSEMEQMGNGAFLSRVVTAGLNRLEEVTNIPQMDTTSNKLVPKRFDIELRDVSFGYEKSRKIIDHVSLLIPQGTTCAIVGPSGSGKTTLCNLIARFWDVQEGQVLVDGQDVKNYTADSLMQYISMVFQSVYLFNDTIENNIRFGNPDASHEQIVEAAKKARCHDFIVSLPEGYNTKVGEGGSTLSGGEKQRISIARAILKDAPIIILDEATSSVDPENEHELLAAIEQLTKGKSWALWKCWTAAPST